MKPKYTKSLDVNHTDICHFLRRNGVEVSDFAGAGTVPDCLLYYKGTAMWMEIKAPTRKAAFTFKQLEYIAFTRMPVAFITNEADALEYATTGKGALLRNQKDAIALLLRQLPKKAYTIKQVEEILG